MRVAGRRIHLATTPAATGSVLAADVDAYRKASVVRERLGTLQGGSLVLLNGDEWRDRRRTLQSGFARNRVDAAGALATESANAMVDDWPTDGPVPMAASVRDLSLAVLARALFGLDLHGDDTPIHAAADDVLARMDMQSLSTYLPEWVPTPTNRRYRRAVATLHDRLDGVVDARTNASDGRPNSSDGRPNASDGRPNDDLLSVMLAAGLPPETVRDELIAFLFAGFDSTATALACTLGSLAANPDSQARVRAELDAVLGDDRPTAVDRTDLPWLNAVVKESLRLYPPQYVLFREPTRPVTVQGYRIEPETTVLLSPWNLHRDDRYWEDSERFDPARWLDDDGELATESDRPEYAYLPYGAGPRHCLGMRLANQTLLLVTAVVCQHRRLRTDDRPTVSAGPTLSLDAPLKLRTELVE